MLANCHFIKEFSWDPENLPIWQMKRAKRIYPFEIIKENILLPTLKLAWRLLVFGIGQNAEIKIRREKQR